MIKLKEKIGYGLGDMASSMFWKLFGAYLMIFYTDVFGLPAAMVGTMFLVTRVWDSVFDPVIGIIADRTSSRWGKFRPYLLFLAVPFGLIGILTFYTPPFGEAGKLVYAYITYSLMMMVYSGINVPYASLEPQPERTRHAFYFPHDVRLHRKFHCPAAVHAHGKRFQRTQYGHSRPTTWLADGCNGHCGNVRLAFLRLLLVDQRTGKTYQGSEKLIEG